MKEAPANFKLSLLPGPSGVWLVLY